ncbi:MAG: anhydro-N-acetylmuramic acid kinase [Bacteroidetes bacterium]|nr:anhydro-N-acetylmuramic acid kinase [Bacteroidota bacterium]MBS1541398.1 anhydro-N-acetylmuramic acid kinase [Bacteroidota bacterium]
MKIKKKSKYRVIGLMSGTSLDGVDLAYVEFSLKKKKWHFSLEASHTFPYPADWRKKLLEAPSLRAEELLSLHTTYGLFLGQLCRQFIEQHKIKKTDFIASHGHTIFHQPQHGLTFQLGNGHAIYAETDVPVVYDFRNLDVTLGGEGAPLVPMGDQLLFSKYDVCLNLGGIANLSLKKNKKIVAFDISFCNMALNYLASQEGKEFDENGNRARSGKINHELLQQLANAYLPYRQKKPSLAREHFEKDFLPLLANSSISIADRLATVCESVAHEIVLTLPQGKFKLLATGGGALNSFLIERINHQLPEKSKITLPKKSIIHFKEAIVFALLGVLRVRNENNVLKSVTGSQRDSCSGSIIG